MSLTCSTVSIVDFEEVNVSQGEPNINATVVITTVKDTILKYATLKMQQ